MALFIRIVAGLALVGAMGVSLMPTPPVRAASAVTAMAPLLAVDPARIQPGQIVAVSGRGFRPGTAVSISMGGTNTGAGGIYGAATVDRSGRFAVDVLPLRYPDGSPLRPGAIDLVAHDASHTQNAGVRLQVVAPIPSASRATIRLPAPGSTATFPLHLLARVAKPGEEVTAVVYWRNGTHLWYTFRALRGEDGRGLLAGTLDHGTIIPRIPRIPRHAAHAATLELRDRSGSLLARQVITVLDAVDPATQVVTVYRVQGEQLVPAAVRVPRTSRPGAAALDALLWGPPTGGPAGITTALPLPQQVLSYPGRGMDWGPRVTLRSLTSVDGVATADFSREMRACGGGSARVALIRGQITRTLLQFATIQHVRIGIEGTIAGALEP
jgi:sporulation and spore germination protein